jgi:phosphatidylethanolamine/phosphatidyl-N-methylethanolamine N-methyltransferase
LANWLGWHSDFPKSVVLQEPSLQLSDEQYLPPFRMMTLLRLTKRG